MKRFKILIFSITHALFNLHLVYTWTWKQAADGWHKLNSIKCDTCGKEYS